MRSNCGVGSSAPPSTCYLWKTRMMSVRCKPIAMKCGSVATELMTDRVQKIWWRRSRKQLLQGVIVDVSMKKVSSDLICEV